MNHPTDPSPEPSTEPPAAVGRDEATLFVTQAGEAAAAAAGLPCVLEVSPHSESRYLHILRGDVWYGVRVSCHEAVYDCCRDYQQLRIEEPPTPEALAKACEVVERLVLSGGEVVADPAAVNVAIDKIAAVLCDGRTHRDDEGLRWRWVADEERWELACRYWGDEAALVPPTHRPSAVVTARIRCQVRHTQNVTARWSAEAAREEN